MGIVFFDLYNSISLNHADVNRKLDIFSQDRVNSSVFALLSSNCHVII